MFDFRRDWHQDDRARPVVRQYQLALDAVLRNRADLASCAVLCCHCGIRFFTHPRNAGRQNLRCPFGCRASHRRQLANARSRKHYQSDTGRKNKKLHNGKRSQPVVDHSGERETAPSESAMPRDPDATSPPSSAAIESAERLHVLDDPPRRDVTLKLGALVLDEQTLVNSSVLSYLTMVTSLLEGRAIDDTELLQLLRESMRQRSIGSLARREYVLRYLSQHPP